MKFFERIKKRFEYDPIEALIENYFQCIYYLTTTDYGDGQDLSLDGDDIIIPEDIKVDENDLLLIHSNIGVYNLHLINLKGRDFLSECAREIVDIINSPGIVIQFDELNTRLQQRVFEKW